VSKRNKDPRHKKVRSSTKRAHSVLKPDTRKQPKSAQVLDFMQMNPAWQFSIMDMEKGGPFTWDGIGGSKLIEIRKKLSNLESMTWSEILVDGKTQYHHVEVRGLNKSAKDRLDKISQGDIDQIISLRLTGKERILGILHSFVLKILWWDPDHKAYPSNKKHT